MNFKTILLKCGKGALAGMTGAIGDLSLSGLNSKSALISALCIVGAAAFTGGFEALHQMVTGTVATRTPANVEIGNPSP